MLVCSSAITRRPRSSDPAARGRDAALRSIAYKRLKHEVKV